MLSPMIITSTKVSIVIPCYNYDKYLVEAVNSILLQKVKPEVILETIIVDDCSTDKSLLIAQEIAKRFESVKVIHNEVNKKLPASMGLPVIATDVGCIRMLLDKDYIVPINPDEEVIKQTNEKLNYLLKNPKERERIGKRNRDHIENFFSWKKTQPIWDSFFYAVYCGNRQDLERFPNYMDNFR